VDAYRAVIADLAATLTGENVEAGRAALRGLVGNVSVFAEGRKLYGRIGLNPAQLLRTSSPAFIESVGSGGGRYELYRNYLLQIQAVASSVTAPA
jgi:hypothetical protein